MDGKMCTTLPGVWEPYGQTWESNRSIRMENVGAADLINPWLRRGPIDFFSQQTIADSVVKGLSTDREKALAIFCFYITHRYHKGNGDNGAQGDVSQAVNVFRFNTCGNSTLCISDLLDKVGMRDNQTLANELDLVRDHDLVKRVHQYGIMSPLSQLRNNEHYAQYYTWEGSSTVQRDGWAWWTMGMVLLSRLWPNGRSARAIVQPEPRDRPERRASEADSGNQTAKPVEVFVFDDGWNEGTEDVTFEVTAVSGATIGAQNVTRLDILDDPPLLFIELDSDEMPENGGSSTGTVSWLRLWSPEYLGLRFQWRPSLPRRHTMGPNSIAGSGKETADYVEDLSQVALGRPGGDRLHNHRSLERERIGDALCALRDGSSSTGGAA